MTFKQSLMRYAVLIFLLLPLLAACQNKTGMVTPTTTNNESVGTSLEAVQNLSFPEVEGVVEPIEKSPEEWANLLNDIEYYILREQGTERSFTGDLWDNKKKGIYSCRACGLPLFSSDTKFRSGTGWPSFTEPIHENYIAETVDNRHGMRRVEVHCARCDGHQGHVFPDGPAPTGLRYCINSAAMDFVEDVD